MSMSSHCTYISIFVIKSLIINEGFTPILPSFLINSVEVVRQRNSPGEKKIITFSWMHIHGHFYLIVHKRRNILGIKLPLFYLIFKCSRSFSCSPHIFTVKCTSTNEDPAKPNKVSPEMKSIYVSSSWKNLAGTFWWKLTGLEVGILTLELMC